MDWTDLSILITGGTGSFGKMFAKKILEEHPEVGKVIIFSRDEFKQFEMSNMTEFKNNNKIRFFIGDVRDKDRLYRAFENIDIVIHSAALKQVPSCEYNPFETIKTNIIGAQNIIEAAIDKKVQKVVALSTDKACSPVNLYGATKLCSDKLFIAGNAYVGKFETKFSVVRYGNVAGSRGSVIPYFQKLINNKAESLPITNFKMTRFWLKLEDAGNMVCNAVETMQGGELYVKKTPSMKITELAKAMAPGLKLREIGIRPGEKIHEVMISKEDAKNTLELDDYFIILPDFEWKPKIRKGKRVEDNFEYNSESNTDWLSIEDMQLLIKEI